MMSWWLVESWISRAIMRANPQVPATATRIMDMLYSFSGVLSSGADVVIYIGSNGKGSLFQHLKADGRPGRCPQQKDLDGCECNTKVNAVTH
jgi:hypothetical protein